MTEKKLDLEQLQGLLVSGYAKQKASCFLLLHIEEAPLARKWLAGLLPDITFFGDKSGSLKHNIAFSAEALSRLGLSTSEVAGFSREFREGMVTPHRGRMLGDLPESPSDPNSWRWGGPRNETPHILLMVYAPSAPSLRERLTALRANTRGVRILTELPSVALAGNKEHFGFRDGMAQPIVAGLHKPGPARDTLAPGEMILGYDDESGAPEPAPESAHNGSYLVLRQIVQDVAGFWDFFKQWEGNAEKIRLATKMMGRWPDGTPLTLSPSPPAIPNPSNDFGFRPDDVDGERCPLGAHIRRANPRDALMKSASRSIQTAKRHRLLRRGRAYGPPLPESVFPRGVRVEIEEGYHEGADERGLYFACLNANISRQFEFVQHSWINNPKFHGLAGESDPISSPTHPSLPGQAPVFTMQGKPLRARIACPQKFVHTVGGGYFFLPGRATLQILSKA